MPHFFALNAAIEALIQGQDPDAKNAKLVIYYGSQLKHAGSWSLSMDISRKKRDSFKGITNEFGNVQIDEDKTENKELGRLIKKERIGHYRIWKSEEGHLKFHHYLASSIPTQSDDTEVIIHHLFYNPETLKELAFAEEYVFKVRKYYIFGECFTRISNKLDVKYGSVPQRYRKRVLKRSQ